MARGERIFVPPPPPPPPPTPPVPMLARQEASLPPPMVEETVPIAAPPPPPSIPPPPVPVPAFASAPAPPPPPARKFDWENLLGVKVFSWAAGILFAIGGIYFLQYSIDKGLLKPPIRMAIGLLAGIGLLVVCELKVAKLYRVTANALDGAGIALLFSTFFASHALWHLIGPIPAFLAMALVTAVAVGLSIHRDSIFIALLGLVGGFATPALLSTGEDRPFGLFGYLLLLNAGLAWVAYRKRWAVLSTLSLLFTVFYQWGWVAKFLTAEKLPIAFGIFAIFPIFAGISLAFGERGVGSASRASALFLRTTAASALLPILFGVYSAAVPAYGSHTGLLFGFLFLVDAGVLVLAATKGPQAIHLAAGLGTLVAVATFLVSSYRATAWPSVLIYLAALVALYLGGPLLMEKRGLPIQGRGARAIYTAPLLLLAFAVLAGIEPLAASPGLLFGVLFALLAAHGAVAIAKEDGGLHLVASFAALAAEAVWSAEHLSREHLLSGLALYAVFSLFYLGVPLLARRLGKSLRPEGTGALLVFVSLGLLFFLAAGSVADAALLGLALLLGVLNLGLLSEAAAGRRPLLCVFGMALSWIVLVVWWVSAAVATLLLPALVVVSGFALLVAAGSVWAKRRAETAGAAG
ncbi:MAG TPA: DUF2339 domain-containing protein, partial [Thermoanaerobaculia bacterium]|nr:DUF2339 domain-containing protein [Thermoanaerobaculia bacterium]